MVTLSSGDAYSRRDKAEAVGLQPSRQNSRRREMRLPASFFVVGSARSAFCHEWTSCYSITSSARPSRAGEIGKFGPYGGARGTGSGPRKKPKVPKFVRCWLFAEGAEIGEPSPTPF